MNRVLFLATVKASNKSIVVTQHDTKGFALSYINNLDNEETEEVFMTYGNEPRYFKSMAGVETTLRENNIFFYTVKMLKEEILKSTRTRYSEEEKQAIEQEKVKAKKKALAERIKALQEKSKAL